MPDQSLVADIDDVSHPEIVGALWRHEPGIPRAERPKQRIQRNRIQVGNIDELVEGLLPAGVPSVRVEAVSAQNRVSMACSRAGLRG